MCISTCPCLSKHAPLCHHATQVEYYFTASSQLPATYWIGMQRADNESLFLGVDGTWLPQFASRNPAWAHWGPTQAIYAFSPYVYNCVAAFGSLAYDM